MTLTAEQRAEITALKRRVKEIESPEWLEKKAARKAERKARSKAIGKPAAGQRQERQLEPIYLAWLRRLPCAVADHECSGAIEAAHLRFSDARYGRINPGLQRKPDDKWATPLCGFHHRHDQHLRREQQFWAERGIEPGALCLDLHAAFADGRDPLLVLAERRRAPVSKEPA